MQLVLKMDSSPDNDSWLEDQWERWLTHDISLEEFEDEDLSEITDECGISLQCKETLSLRPPRAGLLSGGGGGAGSRLQAEMLQMDLIDAAGDTPGAEDDEEDRAAQRLVPGRPEAEHRQEPAPRSQSQGPGGGDTYRPKRPTTLNLFPQVPRSQDTLNNNSLGKKHSWQDRVSRSSSPLKTGKSGLFPLWTFMCPQSPLQRANLTVSSLLGRGKLPVPQPWAGPSEVTCSMRGLTPEPAMDLLPQGGFVIVSVSTC